MVEQTKTESSNQVLYSTFFINNIYCGIDIKLVQEINEESHITEVPLGPDYVVGIMNLRGQIVTVIDQGLKIGIGPSEIHNKNRIVIVSSQDEHIGLLVDKISEVVTTSANEVKAPPPNLQGAQGRFFQGVVQTAENELLAVLDVEAILE